LQAYLQIGLQDGRPLDASQRAPILQAYLQIAPGARPHIPVDKDAPIAEFEKIAAEFPVFRLETIKSESANPS
jgi:hypothetical protein